MAAMTVEVRIVDLEPMKNLIAIFKAMLDDERIPQEIRDEYSAKIDLLLNKGKE